MKHATKEIDLRRWAELVLPWLPSADLAAASATCKVLNNVARTVSARRASDATHGLERHPIPFHNPTAVADGDAQPYSYFLYARFPVIASLSTIPSSQAWGGDPDQIPTFDPSSLAVFVSPVDGAAAGCRCEGCCSVGHGSEPKCPCPSPKIGSLLDSSNELGEPMMMTECGAHCTCGVVCANRSTQKGVSVRLRIVRDHKKGWRLHAAQLIERGRFVCVYAGEFVTSAEAKKRQRLYDELVSVGRLSPALLVVRLCFFAARNIIDGEELTFSYGEANNSQKGFPCSCGSSHCSGTLPSEET